MRPLALALAALAIVPRPAAAQRNIEGQIRDNRDALERIRSERDELQADLQRLVGRVHNVTTELRNIDRQRSATSRLVNELDRQMATLTTQLDTITFDLILAQDALAEKQAVLDRRLMEIYKRGPLWAFEVLLSAESFGDLLSRYKYLAQVSLQDRQLVEEIGTLRDRISAERRNLLSARREVRAQREERRSELFHYADLERERQRTLSQMRQSEQETLARIAALEREEHQLNEMIASLERARRAGGAATPGTPSIASTDLGRLDWPVEGELVYRFGPQSFRDGTSIRYRGIGIRTPVGTPVRAVRAGMVVWSRPYGTYGPSVWIDHGGGFYTLYLHLSRVDVEQREVVVANQVVGLSGGVGTDEGPHIEFQIRQMPANAATPIPLDPLNWLKRRR